MNNPEHDFYTALTIQACRPHNSFTPERSNKASMKGVDVKNNHVSSRRRFFKQAAAAGLGSLLLNVPGVFAEQLAATPEQTEGPYYPPTLPLDTDNDLLVINSAITPAVGTIAYLSGTVLDSSGSPVRDAYVEIWHADNTGSYIHPSSMGYANRDKNFQ